MRAEMTSRERMLAALGREESDHVPFSLYLGNSAYWGEPLVWNDQIEGSKRQLELKIDPTFDLWLPRPQPHKDVEIKTWREKKGSEILITKEYHTPAGVLRQVVKESEDWCASRHGPWIPTTWGVEKRTHMNIDLFDDYNVSRRVEPWIKGREDLAKLRYLILPAEGHLLDEWRMDAERAIEYAEKLGVITMSRRTIVGDAYQWLCDIPWFLMQFYDDPEFVREFFSILQEWSMHMVKLSLEAGVDVVQYRGWYEIPTFFGIDFWKEFINPCIEEQAEMTHQAGKLFNYLLPEGHGAYADMLGDLTNLDACQGVDPRMLHGGDLYTLFEKLGDKKTFWGGVNAETTLTTDPGNYEEIEREVAEAVDALGSNNGLILSAFIFKEVPMQGTMNMIKAWKKVCNIK